MEVTEVRIKIMEDAGQRLQAFCSITLDDCFVIRDLKIIERATGPFVAMPSRKLTSHCPQCGCKNYLRAAYCNQCGLRLPQDQTAKDEEGRAKLYADIAHPINSACREMIQQRVISEFHAELERMKQPGYVSRYDDFDAEDDLVDTSPPAAAKTLRYDLPEKAGQRLNLNTAPQTSPQNSSAPQTKSTSAGGKQTIVQPAENVVRAPHHAQKPSGQSSRPSSGGGQSSKGEFGAGVF